MTKEEKLQAARKLQELRPWGTPKPPKDMPEQLRTLRARQLERIQSVMAEIQADAFSDQQLQALLDFYGSDLGKSIVRAEHDIAERFSVAMQELATELNDEAARNSTGALRSWHGSRGSSRGGQDT